MYVWNSLSPYQVTDNAAVQEVVFPILPLSYVDYQVVPKYLTDRVEGAQ